MIIRVTPEFWKYTDFQDEIKVSGKTLGDCIEKLLNQFPQLYIHLMDNQAEEARKSAFHLNGEFVWNQDECDRLVKEDDILVLNKEVPTGEGAVGKMIVGVVMIIVGAALAVFSGGTLAAIGGYMWKMGVAIALSGVAEAIMGTPSVPTMSNEAQNSTPTYTFSGIRNTTAVGTPISVVYGEHRVGGHLLNVYTDAEGTDNYLYAQIGLCEGEIEGIVLTNENVSTSYDIKINKNPLNFYRGVDIQFKNGAKDQAAMSWFNRVENSTSVGSIILNGGASVVYQTTKEVNAAKITISAPQLYYSHPEEGLQPTSVSYEIYYRKLGDSVFTKYEQIDYVAANPSVNNFYISGKTKSETVQEHLINFKQLGLPLAVYELRIDRITADHTGSLDIGDTIYLKTVNEIVYDTFTYPYTALLGLKIKATEQLSGSMPTITTKIRGLKVLVPNVYDGPTRTYTNTVWDGTFKAQKEYTNNPVWCLYDYLTNTRYGLGDYYKIDQNRLGLMKAQFFLMARYCDELLSHKNADGTFRTEPRFSLNLVMDNSKNANEWANVIAAGMRAILFYTEGRIWLEIDRKKPITQLFNMSDIEKGSFSQQGTSYKQIPNTYEVQYPNPEKDYEMDMFRVESVEVQTNPFKEERKKALDLIGVTSETQCKILAKYALYAGSLNTKIVSFKTGTKALQSMVGNVVGLQHDVPQWGYGGKIVSVSGATLTLSSDVTIENGSTYEIQVSHKGGSPEIAAITAPVGITREVTLQRNFSFTPEKDDVYVIGEISNAVKPFKILYIKRDSDEKIELKVAEYNEELFDFSENLDDLTAPVPVNYSQLQDPTQVSVTNFVATEKVYLANDGTVKTGIECFYTPQFQSSFWNGVVINYGLVGTGVYEQMPVDKTGYVFIPNLVEGQTYQLVAQSVFKDNTRQLLSTVLADLVNKPFAVIDLLGKKAPPANVNGFTIVQDARNNNYFNFKWQPVTDVDLSHYELRKGTDWALAEIIKTNIKETYYNELFIQTSGSYSFLIKAVDTSGNYSTTPTLATITAKVEPEDVHGFQARQLGDSIQLTWGRNSDIDLLGYEIRQGITWDNSLVLQSAVAETFYQLDGVVNGTYKFYIKAIDKFGNYSINATTTQITTVNIPLRNVLVVFDESKQVNEPSLSGGVWPGTRSNVIVNAGNLTLDSVNKYDSGLFYDTPGLIYDETVIGTGIYITPIYNLGVIVNCKVILDYDVTQGAGDSILVEISTSHGAVVPQYWDSFVRWDSGAVWDNIYWTNFTQFAGGYVTAKYVRFRLTLLNNSGTLSISKFRSIFDVPDLVQRGSNVNISSTGTAITFTTPYVAAPTISLTAIGAGVPRIETKNNTQFTVKVYDNGVPINGIIDWISNGY